MVQTGKLPGPWLSWGNTRTLRRSWDGYINGKDLFVEEEGSHIHSSLGSKRD